MKQTIRTALLDAGQKLHSKIMASIWHQSNTAISDESYWLSTFAVWCIAHWFNHYCNICCG